MISFVTWKWQTANSPRVFRSKHVNVVYAMVARWYSEPFRFICITDDTYGLDERIEVLNLNALPNCPTFDGIDNPSGARFPNCYRRLWNFSREAKMLGERIFCVDIDVIITGNLKPLINRDEDFVGWCDSGRFKNADGSVQNKIAGGAYLLRTGSMPHIWEEFDPKRSPIEALQAGNGGSDQGWMSYKLYPPPGYWNGKDGLVKLNWTPTGATIPPKQARMVFTSGINPPWCKETRNKYPWIRDWWRNG